MKLNIGKSLMLAAACLTAVCAGSQELYKSVPQSPYTFYYSISNEEAAAFFADPKPQKIYPLLHTKVDSVLTALYADPKLQNGHYIRVRTRSNKVYADVMTVQHFFPYVFNNGNDLMVRVLDTLGQNIASAEVFAGKARLKYDKKMQLYTLPKAKNGLLLIRYEGLDAYYKLSNSLASRKGANEPLYIVNGKEVSNISSIPPSEVYAVNVLKGDEAIAAYGEKGANGVVVITTKSGYRPVEIGKTAEPYFFAVASQPKYRPNDTVRFKFYLLDSRKRFVRDSVNVFVSQDSKKKVMTLSPYAAGLYTGSFVLDDSLELRLDQPVALEVAKATDPKQKAKYENLFIYEDYELKSSSLSLRLDEEKQLYGDSLIAYATAMDGNDLPLSSAKLIVNASRPYFSKSFERLSYFPVMGLYSDTLTLAPDGTARIAIPWQQMPKANFSYDISVTLLTPDGERTVENRTVSFVYKDEQIKRSISSGKVHFEYLVSGKSSSGFAYIYGYDSNGKLIQQESGNLPYSIALDPYINKYKVTVGDKTEFIGMDDTPDSLYVTAVRKPNSVVFTTTNPRRINFNYFVYCGSKLVKKGTGKEFRFSSREKLNQDYFVSLQYMWGGRVKSREFSSYYESDDVLRLSVKQKPMVFPGETSTVEVTATRKGAPVAGVDITAYAPTAKFHPSLPEDFFTFGTPSFAERRKAFDYKLRQVVLPNSIEFNMDRLDTTFFGRLDTIERYRFMYPDTPYYKARVPASVPQIAPFVFSKGQQIPVHVVYVDNRPVYISFVTNNNAFSSMVVPGRHQLWVRTADYLYDLGIVEVRAGEKLIVSLDADKFENKASCMRALSDSEREQLLSCLMPIDGKRADRFVVQNDVVLNPGFGGRDVIAGPVSRGNVSLVCDNSVHEFEFLPDNKYDFTDTSRVAITPFTISAHQEYTSFPHHVPVQGVTDSVYTVSQLKHDIAFRKMSLRDNARASFDYPCFGSGVEDSLSFVDLSAVRYKFSADSLKSQCLNYIALTQDSTVVGIFNSNSVWLPQGEYIIYALFADDSYATVPVSVRKGYSTHVSDNVLVCRPSSRSDVYGEFLDMIAQTVLVSNPSFYQSMLRALNQPFARTALQVYDLSKEKQKLSVSSNKFGCFVKDSKGLPVADATVVVTTDHSTRLTTKTDFSGFFSFTVPNSVRSLAAVITAHNFRPYEIAIDIEPKSGNSIEETSVTLTPAYSGFTEYSRPYYLVDGAEPKWNNYSMLTPLRDGGDIAYSMPGVPSSFDDAVRVRGVASLESSSSAPASPLYVVDGVVRDDISDIPASSIKKMERLRRVPSIYGARGKANGVIVVTTNRNNTQDPVVNEAYVSSETSSSIRSNFSDCAFWQPSLTTDADGKASFTVAFPDDVTRWKTYFLGLESNKYSAVAEGDVLSYKPLMAQLSAPRFMIQGDTASVIGTVRSTGSSAEALSVSFAVDSVNVASRNVNLRPRTGYVDSARIVAPVTSDTLTASFRLDRASDGYYDGERKTIPLLPRGMSKTEGQFAVLSSDTTISISLPQGASDLMLVSGELPLVQTEIEKLSQSRYMCNEQLASRLYAYLLKDQFCRKHDTKFREKKEVRKLIKALWENQNAEGGWGWWNVSSTELWITSHVVDALLLARSLGYNVPLRVSFDDMSERLSMEMTYDYAPSKLLQLALLSYSIAPGRNYASVISAIDAKIAKREADGRPVYPFSTQELFQFVRLKQQCSQPYSLSVLSPFMAKTSAGNLYFTSYTDRESLARLPYSNDVALSLVGYDILAAALDSRAVKVRNGFYERMGVDGWGNTYLSAKVLGHLASSLQPDDSYAVVNVSGAAKARVDSFPYIMPVSGKSITLTKKGKAPVFASVVKSSWVANPKADFTYATVSTAVPELTVGKQASLTVNVDLKASAEYVRIEVPIPAGCSYEDDSKLWSAGESYRECHKDKVVIYCRSLSQGSHKFTIPLMPRFRGSYTMNPARMDLMYFPAISANSAMQRVVVK